MKAKQSLKSLENKNRIISNESVEQLPNGYFEWKNNIEQLIEISKLRSAINVNTDTLALYWNIGNSILQKQQNEGWGKKIIEQLSKDLSNRFPNDRGYSERNLRNMKYFAQEYPDFPILQVPLAKLKGQAIWQVPLAKLEDSKQELVQFYISAVDEYVKTPEDKPTIGLLLCRDKSNKKVEFTLRGITQPMGIARYETEKLFADVASSLPKIEDLERILEEE